MRPTRQVPILTLLAAAATTACGPNPTSTVDPGTNPPSFALGPPSSGGGVTQGLLEVCKVGTDATIDVSVNSAASTAIAVTDGTCVTAATVTTVTTASAAETPPTGIILDSILVIHGGANGRGGALTVDTTRVTGSNSASGSLGFEAGLKFVFYNHVAPPAPPVGVGRMTGGGRQITAGGLSISRGFTIHCDITLSNNIELNWGKNQWHLEKPITKALCLDDPNIDQRPPNAPFDTFIGEAIGRLNGVDGSLLKFTFVDAGEPGRNDLAGFQIWDPNGNLVLTVPLSKLDNGNIQAHFDQPHK